MTRKIFLLIPLLALCGCESASTPNSDTAQGETIGLDRNSNVKISYVRPRYCEDWQTRSIGEALTSEEHTHGYLTLRSQPESRDGMYFFIMIDWGPKDILLASSIELYVDSSQMPKVRKYTFTIPETHSVLREIKLALTGGDWKGDEEKVNAWKVVIKTPTGKVVAEKQSWLWSINDEPKVDEKQAD